MFYWYFIFIILYFTSCVSIQRFQPEDLLLQKPYIEKNSEELSNEQINKDIDFLIYGFTNGYGARKFINQKQLEDTLNRINSLKQSSAVINQKTFCSEIDSAFLTIADNHLAARLNGENCSPIRKDAVGRVGLNVGHNLVSPWAITYRRIGRFQIPILSITRFDKHEDPVWNGFLDSLKNVIKSSKALIIDLRGNGGGDDTMGIEAARMLYGAAPPSPVEATVSSQTPASLAALANTWKLKQFRNQNEGKSVPEFVTKRLQAKLVLFQSALKSEIPEEKIVYDKTPTGFNIKEGFSKPITILIDRGCASSCESTLELFEEHPFTETIGENTNGDIHFAEAGILILPYSKIQIQFGTQFTRYKDRRFVEKTGYPPKVPVAPDSDALIVALERIAKKIGAH